MSFSEESLEDKIAAIMNGNYNFGPPIKPPVNIRAATPVITPVIAPSDVPTSSVPDLAATGSLPRTSSGKKVQIEEPAPIVAERVAEKPVTSKAKVNAGKEFHEIKRVKSVFVGYGDVYDDANEIEYDGQTLHQDAESDGHDDGTGTDSAALDDNDSANEMDADEGDEEEEKEEVVKESGTKATGVAFVEEAEDSPASRVQPQLDFIPLSARKTSPVPSGNTGDKDLSLDTDRTARATKQKEEEARPERTDEPAMHTGVGAASVAWKAPTPTAPLSSITKPVYDPSAMTDVASPIDSKVQSLLFGEDSGGEDDASEHDQKTLSFEPDEAPKTHALEPVDDDSLNGDAPQEDPHDSEDLTQTIRTTLPLPGSTGAVSVPEEAAARPAPVVSAAVLSIPPARVPVSKPPKSPAANPTTVPAVPVVAPVQPKAKHVTHANEAREQAAFLLPTIPETVPAAKPRSVTPQSLPKPSGPIKVTSDKDDHHDHSKFLARISAATSVPIEAPPAPKPRPTTPTSIPHRAAKEPVHVPVEATEEPEAIPTPAPVTPTMSNPLRSTPKKAAAEPVPTVINISPPRGRAVAEPPVLSSSKRTTSPASIRKAPAVLMSTTSADEIAAASAGAAAHTATKTPTRSKSPARSTPAKAAPSTAPTAPAAAPAASTSMKESALLGNSNTSNAVQGIKIPSLKKDTTTPGKVKTPAWVEIGRASCRERVSDPV